MKNFKFLVFLGITLFISNPVFSQENEFYKSKVYMENQDSLKYRIMFPKDFSEDHTYPLVLFLHGAGERGNNNESQLVHGSKLFASEIARDSFPAIVIFPQCPKTDYWANAVVDRTTKPLKIEFPENKKPTKALASVINLLQNYMGKDYVDKDRIYVAGLSMGAMGTFELLERMPNTFAAALAICGGDNPEAVAAYAKNTPMWIFHGAKDDVVDPNLSIDIVSELLKLGAHPNFNLYANANHNSWDSAFAEPGLLKWLFSKSKSE